MTGPGVRPVRPEQVVGGGRGGGEEDVSADHGVSSQAVGGNIELQRSEHGHNDGGRQFTNISGSRHLF